jgi:hypothetical protein
MREFFLRFATAAALLVTFAATARAQTTQTTVVPPYEVGVGYQLLQIGEVCDDGTITQSCLPDRTYAFGLNADVVRNFGTVGLGVVGEVGFSRDSEDEVNFSIWQFGGGIRWTWRANPKFAPYGQLLLGWARSGLNDDASDFEASSTDFMVQPGVGVNYAINPRINLFGQLDLRRVHIGDVGVDDDDDFADLPISIEDVTRTDFRFVIGVRFGIGAT